MRETVNSEALDAQGKLDELHDEIDACVRCRTAGQTIVKPPSMFRGVAGSTVMAVGIAPGRGAIRAGLAFAGQSIRRLLGWFASAGYVMSEDVFRRSLYFTSLNKCAVDPDGPTNRRELWSRCNPFLWRQLECVGPRLVLVLGQEPAKMILGMSGNPAHMIVGSVWTTVDIFGSQLFPPSTLDARWLLIPHPSGLSRTMNDPAIQSLVISALRTELIAANFVPVT